jgi:hypothetical protein
MSGFGYNVLGFGANASSAAGGPVDDEFNRVSFLSHFDGANNGVNNVFDDGSTSNHTITANGNVTQGSFNPYGTNWAVDFSKDANPRLSCGSSSDFTFGTGDFTVEFFVFFYSLTSYQTPMSAGYSNDSGGMFIQTGNGDGKFQFRSGGSALVSETTSDAEANKWYHIAFSRQSGTLRVYRNGVQTGTASNSTNLNRTGNILIGSDQDFNIDGLLSNFRLVKGTSLYNSNFTPPASALTAVTNTKLLTLQSNRFVDNSASGHTVTPNTGTETIGSFGPFLTSSVYDAAVNGASSIGGYVAAATSTDWQFGSGNFTVEFWTYPLGTGSWVIAHGVGDVTGSAISWQYGYGTFDFYYGSSSVQITSPTLTLNSWQHIAVVRNGATITVYKDGVATGTANIGSNSLNTGGTSPFYVGAYPGAASSNINGYLSDVRVVKGTAVYTSAFTPPTAPLTAVTNTKLLLNMADGQAIDSAAQNNLTLYGTAKTSTAQYKFGTASLLLDGNSDYVAIPAINLTGSFTLEFFAYLNAWPNSSNFDMFYGQASSVYMCFTSGINGSGSDRSIQLAYDPSGYSGITQFNVNSAMNSGAWHHVAITKNSSNVHVCYIDGTAVPATNATKANTFFTTGTHFIGRGYSPSYHYFGGYIDDFRISQLVRYTSNFTPPTAAFADKGQ